MDTDVIHIHKERECLQIYAFYFLASDSKDLFRSRGIEVRGDIKLTERLDVLPPKKKRMRNLLAGMERGTSVVGCWSIFFG